LPLPPSAASPSARAAGVVMTGAPSSPGKRVQIYHIKSV
jgi:hypothetical protein